jgi:WD40 repeat protein
MNEITHKQAQRYLRMDLDGLLTEAQGLDLETHLRECETCHADSESFAALTRRLHTGFHSRWDAQDGPSKEIMEHIHSQSRRIVMQKRISFAFNTFGGIVALLVLLFVISSIAAQLQKKSSASSGTQTTVPASSTETRLLAFSSEKDGNSEIYTMQSDGSGMTNITNNPARDANPFWSPAGKRIAFQSNRNSEYYSQIFLMDADGSNVVLLTTEKSEHQLFFDEGTNPWSPDGSKLLYFRKAPSEGEWILQMIDINNGDVTSLATGRNDIFSSISWSPDGEHIAFIRGDPQSLELGNYIPQIYVVNADGTNLISITSLLPTDEAFQWPITTYEWSRDGESIFFSASNMAANTSSENPTEKLYEARLNSSALVLHATTRRSRIGGWWDETYFITPFMGSGGWTWVYPDGSFNTINPTKECEQERVYHPEDKSYRSAVASFSRSPNGNGVIIASCPDGNVHLSWVNPTGTEIIPIAKLSTAPVVEFLSGVQWSQDDKFIAVQINTINNIYMYVLNVDKAKNTPLQALQPILIQTGNNHGRPTYPSLQPMP